MSTERPGHSSSLQKACEGGDLVTLEDQDRAGWDRSAITEGPTPRPGETGDRLAVEALHRLGDHG